MQCVYAILFFKHQCSKSTQNLYSILSGNDPCYKGDNATSMASTAHSRHSKRKPNKEVGDIVTVSDCVYAFIGLVETVLTILHLRD